MIVSAPRLLLRSGCPLGTVARDIFVRRFASRVGHGPPRVQWQGRTVASRPPKYEIQKKLRGKMYVGPTYGFAASPKVGPGATVGTPRTRYLRVQALRRARRELVQSHRGARVLPHIPWHQLPPPSFGRLGCHHTSHGASSCLSARGSSGAAMRPMRPAPASRLEAAQVLPRVLWHQLLPPSLGQLGCHHTSRGISSCLPARGSSVPPRVPWR
jgi:hypothetical protein